MDRRELLKAGVLASAALSLGVAPARGAPAQEARRQAFRALAAGLSEVPGGCFRALDAGRALRAYDRWYARAAPPQRAHADAVLDGLAGLRDDPQAIMRRPEAAAPIAAGIGLVALVSEPEPEDDARALAPAL